MARSLKKGFYINPKITKKVQAMLDSGEKKVVKIWDRSSQITPEMIGFTFEIGRAHV